MLKFGLVRHAKSSWDNPTLNDHDRPLNLRGKRDAPVMAQKVHELFGVPDLLVSSTANRAFTTAKVFRKEIGLEETQLLSKPGLYHSTENDVMEAISLIDDNVKFVLIFAHNPTMTFLANSFKGDMINNVPTCGVVMLESSAASWAEVHTSNTKRVQFIYPKMYV